AKPSHGEPSLSRHAAFGNSCFTRSTSTASSSAQVSLSHHQHQYRQYSCNTLALEMCYGLPRFRHRPPLPPFLPLPPPPPPPLAPPGDDEIDPRYGVEKRLVPSGPNPLHN
ncbi:hypothetical protein NMG60_11036161, partial [Bertholletia excelsa]